MANEATITSSLRINKSSGSTIILQYQSMPQSYSADVAGTAGPFPGLVNLVPGAWTLIELAGGTCGKLTTPGLCRFMNLDATNYIMFGIYDGASTFPFLELLPGESFVVRLSRHVDQEFSGTGTGTIANTNSIAGLADTAACKALVEAFEV